MGMKRLAVAALALKRPAWLGKDRLGSPGGKPWGGASAGQPAGWAAAPMHGTPCRVEQWQQCQRPARVGADGRYTLWMGSAVVDWAWANAQCGGVHCQAKVATGKSGMTGRDFAAHALARQQLPAMVRNVGSAKASAAEQRRVEAATASRRWAARQGSASADLATESQPSMGSQARASA